MSLRIDGLSGLIKKLEQIEKRVPGAANIFLMQQAELLLTKVRLKTPIGKVNGGTLRGNWFRTDPEGGRISVANNTEYAAHVEYGHRQTPGRFVPALGKRLVKDFVEGRFMLRDAVWEHEKEFHENAAEILRGLMR